MVVVATLAVRCCVTVFLRLTIPVFSFFLSFVLSFLLLLFLFCSLAFPGYYDGLMLLFFSSFFSLEGAVRRLAQRNNKNDG